TAQPNYPIPLISFLYSRNSVLELWIEIRHVLLEHK
ncbi:unnamed protein product, partial [Allacma fusca]